MAGQRIVRVEFHASVLTEDTFRVVLETLGALLKPEHVVNKDDA